MRAARAAGTRVVLDIDYRPVLWGLTAPGLGEQRYVKSDPVSENLQSVLHLCDLVVGTEEDLVRKQFGVVDRNRARQRVAVAAVNGGIADALDEALVAFGESAPLIGGQEVAAMGDHWTRSTEFT